MRTCPRDGLTPWLRRGDKETRQGTQGSEGVAAIRHRAVLQNPTRGLQKRNMQEESHIQGVANYPLSERGPETNIRGD